MAKKGRKLRMDEMVDDQAKMAAIKEMRDAQIAKDAAMMKARYPEPPAPQMPPPPMPPAGGPSMPPPGAPAMKKGGSVKTKVKCMSRGGGCEVRGKTKGRFI
jgi:hypothetical protein